MYTENNISTISVVWGEDVTLHTPERRTKQHHQVLSTSQKHHLYIIPGSSIVWKKETCIKSFTNVIMPWKLGHIFCNLHVWHMSPKLLSEFLDMRAILFFYFFCFIWSFIFFFSILMEFKKSLQLSLLNMLNVGNLWLKQNIMMSRSKHSQ